MKRKNLKKYKKILNRLITVTMLLVIIMNFVSPMINESFGALGSIYESKNKDKDSVDAGMQAVLSTSMGAVGSAISAVILLVVGILYMILVLIFTPVMGFNFLPGPEDIIYNGVPIFDPNFIAPGNAEGAKIYLVGENGPVKTIVQQFYQTGFVVAGSIFVIGAMIIGIKLAVTSIASEKAYYKEMIGTWIKGLVLLFTVHILITACFYVNEKIVDSLYEVVKTDEMEFTITYEIPGSIGKLISTIVAFSTGENLKLEYKGIGIGGIVTGLLIRAFANGDIISAIAVAALLGQICSLVVTYFKRVFVCIALAAIAPYIVAVDFIRKLI